MRRLLLCFGAESELSAGAAALLQWLLPPVKPARPRA
jgi:hypothetical protein